MSTPLMNLTLPVVSSTPGPTYAVQVNAALVSIDSHNHTNGRGSQIPTAGISINADLPMAGYSLSNANSVRMVNQAGTLAGAEVNSVYAVLGNLYFNNAIGTPVQITAGTALNAAAFGGFAGDYVAAAAQASYSQAFNAYSLLNASNGLSTLYVNKLGVGVANLSLLGSNSLQVTGPIAGSSTISSTANMLCGGTLVAANVNCNAGTLTSNTVTTTNLAVTSVGSVTGSFTAGSVTTPTLTVSGLTTLNTASATSIASATGTFSGALSASSCTLTSDTVVGIPASTQAIPQTVMHTFGVNVGTNTSGPSMAVSPGNWFYIPLRVPLSCTITGFSATMISSSGGGANVDIRLMGGSPTTGVGGAMSNTTGSLPADLLTCAVPGTSTRTTFTQTGGTLAISANSDATFVMRFLPSSSQASTSNVFTLAGLSVSVSLSSITTGGR